MKLFIEIDIGPIPEARRDKSWIQYASSLASDLMGTGLEGNSEDAVLGMVVQLMGRSEKTVLLLNVHDQGDSVGCPASLLNALSEAGHPFQVWVLGIHASTEQQLTQYAIPFSRVEEDQLKGMIRDFAQ